MRMRWADETLRRTRKNHQRNTMANSRICVIPRQFQNDRFKSARAQIRESRLASQQRIGRARIDRSPLFRRLAIRALARPPHRVAAPGAHGDRSAARRSPMYRYAAGAIDANLPAPLMIATPARSLRSDHARSVYRRHAIRNR
ncbi:hypothetical protein Bcep1808_4899 [Burkholderia vietnamiensis G4]|uniref:Uncharacterized protein n=1 Tax=Burkholderia vietnamiensis (strain G4 / LMG 22486) TaxID=269482 RepID=A4JNK3_BURVG|nr:hypothetical protein Bcep1808_4899 [Burkholderia vietnamiensis G4]